MHGPCRRVCDDLNGEDTRTSAESSYTTQLRVQATTHTHSNSTTIVLRVPSTIAGTEICLRCWRDRPFLNRTHLVFDEVVPMGRQEATQPNSDIQHNRTAFKRNKQTRGMWILRKNAKDLENHQRLKRKPSFSVLQSWANLWNVSCSWSCFSRYRVLGVADDPSRPRQG